MRLAGEHKLPAPQVSPETVRDDNPLAEIADCCAAVAREMAADEFSIFTVVHAARRSRLVAVLDSAFPSVSIISRLISTAQSGELADRVQISTKPFWWSGRGASSLRTLRWADPVMPPFPGSEGIAFPAYDERGQGALLLFTGRTLELDDRTLALHHARCFSLFEACAAARNQTPARMISLSKRERECLSLTANGHTSEEIAAILGLSVHTTNQHVGHIMEKLNATSRMHAVAKALRMGLIE
ncbi:MAG: LuxR family transcriptional regulator [Rhizobiaceae bacterium]|nr:MAG: LuxR family transcriptional regulator [Rhizobiaceae bacterium]